MISRFQRSLDAVTIHAPLTGSSTPPSWVVSIPAEFCLQASELQDDAEPAFLRRPFRARHTDATRAGRPRSISTCECHQDSAAVWGDYAAMAGAISGLEAAGGGDAARQPRGGRQNDRCGVRPERRKSVAGDLRRVRREAA